MNEENFVPTPLAEEIPVPVEKAPVQLPECPAEPAPEGVSAIPLSEPEVQAQACPEPVLQPEAPAAPPQKEPVAPGYIPPQPRNTPYPPAGHAHTQGYPGYQNTQQRPAYPHPQQGVYQNPQQRPVYPHPQQAPLQPGQYPYPPRPQFDMHYGTPPQPKAVAKKVPRKKHTWLRITLAVLLAITVVALSVWGIISGATALIHSFAGDEKDEVDSSYSFNYNGSGFDQNHIMVPGGSVDGENMVIVDDSSNILVENGIIYDSQGNMIGVMSDGTSDGHTVTIIPPSSLTTEQETDVPGYYPDPVYYVRAEGGLNMRTEPSTQGQLILNIPNGTPLMPGVWENGWAYVEYQDRIGWVSGDYLSTTPTARQELYYVHAEGGLNMRSIPSTTGERIANIPDGTAVYVLTWQDNWAYLEWNGNSGWCRGDFLSREHHSAPSGSQGYTQSQIDRAISKAKDYYRSRMGKNPGRGYTDSSLTTEEVEALYWKAVSLTTVDYYPAGRFSGHGDYLVIDGAPTLLIEVWDEEIRTMEDWANLFYCCLSDEQAYSLLCQNCLFELDGKLYISAGAYGDEGLETHYTIDIQQETNGYALTLDVVNIRDYGVREEIKWSETFHCFKEDGVWVFDGAATPYQ